MSGVRRQAKVYYIDSFSSSFPLSNVPIFSVLGKAIHSIAKIGEDLYIDPLSDGLAFRSMNSARSAFITYKFHPNFFEVYEEKTSEDLEVILQYEDPPSNSSQSSQNPSKCRLAMRVRSVRLYIALLTTKTTFPNSSLY
jgi:hypothetical protein